LEFAESDREQRRAILDHTDALEGHARAIEDLTKALECQALEGQAWRQRVQRLELWAAAFERVGLARRLKWLLLGR